MELLRSDLRRFFSIEDRFSERPLFVYIFLILFGLITAYFIVSRYNCLTEEQFQMMDDVYMITRRNWLTDAVRSVQENGYVASLPEDHSSALYLYAGHLGALVGKTEGWQVFLFIQMGAAAFLLTVYPSVIYRLTDSLIAALSSPFLVDLFAGEVLYKTKGDIDYDLAWIIVMGLPLVILFCKEKHPRIKWTIFGLLCFVMGIGNLLRMHASLPILFLIIVVLFGQQVKQCRANTSRRNLFRSIASCTGFVLICFISYELFIYIIPNLYEIAIGNGFHGKFSFGPWHSVYIGLGWEENKYGIQCTDAYGSQVAQAIDPNAFYPNARCMEVLRDEWFRLWREDPGFMLQTYFRKFITCLKNDFLYSFCGSNTRGGVFKSTYRFAPEYSGFSGVYCLCIFVVCVAVLRYCMKQKNVLKPWAVAFLFSVVCMIIGMDMGIMQRPWTGYIFGSFASCSMIFIFISVALITAAEKALREFIG